LHAYLASPPPQRARLAWHAEVVADATAADRALRLGLAPTLDTVVLEAPPRGFRPQRPAEAATITWLQDDPDRLACSVDLHDGRGYLGISDAWAPGWRATVDGEPAEVLHADLAFRAVALREGSHIVRMVYRPLGGRIGPWSFGAGLLLLAILGLASRNRRRRVRA
jgi:hypothetical protein